MCNAYTFGASKAHKVHAKATLEATYACSLKKCAYKGGHSHSLLTSTFKRKTDYRNGNEKLLLSLRKLNLCLLVLVVVLLRWRSELRR